MYVCAKLAISKIARYDLTIDLGWRDYYLLLVRGISDSILCSSIKI